MIFRKAILIIHGFAGGTYDEEELANFLELDRSFDVYRFTLPGHAKNLSKVRYEEWIKKSEEYLLRLINHGYHSIYLIGHSMGGVIATYLASQYKEVKKLVLAAPAFQYLSDKRENNNVRETLRDAKSLAKTYGIDEIFSRFLKLDLSAISEFRKLIYNYYDYPKEVTCPVLLIHGKNDKLIHPESSKYAYSTIPSRKKTLILVKGITHDVFRSKRDDELFKIVKKFLKHSYKKGEYNI